MPASSRLRSSSPGLGPSEAVFKQLARKRLDALGREVRHRRALEILGPIAERLPHSRMAAQVLRVQLVMAEHHGREVRVLGALVSCSAPTAIAAACRR